MEKEKEEVFVSVDVETDGPIPGDYSLLSIGACLVDNIETGFYRELQPISDKFDPEALAVSGLDRNRLIREGLGPRMAMLQFRDWLRSVCWPEKSPIFVAFNATFDWMFTHWYFIHFLAEDPFGFSGLDIKAYYAGTARIHSWDETSKSRIEARFLSELPHTHNALDDAREQAAIFQNLRREAGVI